MFESDYQTRTQTGLLVYKDCLSIRLLVGIKGVTLMCSYPQSHMAAQWNASRPHMAIRSSSHLRASLMTVSILLASSSGLSTERSVFMKEKQSIQFVLRKTLIAFPVSRLASCGNLNKDGCDETSAVEKELGQGHLQKCN